MFSQELLEQAESGDTDAMRELSAAYLFAEGVSPNIREARKWIEKAAELGNVEAQAELADILRTQNYLKEAFDWEYKAAMQGRIKSHYNLAVHYRDGMGTYVDFREQFYWFQKAAVQGRHAVAMHELGRCYLNGAGTLRDDKHAFYWFQKAVISGDVGAKVSLGTCYYIGRGVTADKEKAIYLWQEALQQGDEKTKKRARGNLQNSYGTLRDFQKK